ncbi:class I SAM-dependent methyltransferase [Streptomyces sp. NPDC057675]|uniref:class I SAM-dependent methyltransferase n=1 Tax=Streptomyces sp. NPDC057675 TaxID=3346204 RepID=UPI0036BE5886
MSGGRFEYESVFDEDYLYFMSERLSDAQSDTDAALIDELFSEHPGDLLDLACGHGRIANRLSGRGYRVTGLDSSRLFLNRAQADARARDVSVEYVHGDMRNLPWSEKFDYVVNWFGSFGYFDDDHNKIVLDQAAQALRPGGTLAIEMPNYSALLRHYQSVSVIEREGNFLVDHNSFDALTSRSIVKRTILKDGLTRRSHFFVRLFTYVELKEWLTAAGFREVRGVDETGGSLTDGSRRMIILARK